MNSIEGRIREKLPTLQADRIEENLIVYPQSSEEVSSFIKLCNDEKISMVPIGSGSQIIGADKTKVYLSMRKMNRIVELAKADLTVSVEAGISIKELAEALREYNFLLPVSHHEKPNSTIGGLLARDAGGIEQYARGTIHDYLLGLEFITPTGELIKTGGKTVKNVTGYDFTRLFAKSWGTLGVIVKATFKLIPMPVEKALFITYAASIDDLTQQMKEVLAKRYALVSFMGMSGKLLGLDEGPKYGGVFVLAGSRQAVTHQLDSLKSLLDIKQIITGTNSVDDYLEDLLGSKASQAEIILGTDRRTLLDYLPRELDAILDNTSMDILLDGGSGLVQLTTTANVQEVKKMLGERLQEFNFSFSDERSPVDILYNRIKRNLDPNRIMYPNNPRFVEVS
ncbi:FAD-binding oxidoreductase [Desulfitibacter alkalitolerans]|uniref:FAD-binding oxidoreductase n=1 Tax=Desulfitibacter alkalitolerans TaxID=264641 RepID=UPI00048262A4|nr:FAD-binding oxidoreductase [Desulfitibacter alkalitolerans]